MIVGCDSQPEQLYWRYLTHHTPLLITTHTDAQPPSSMATPNRHNHEFTTQRRKDSAYPTNPSRNTFCSTLINQSNQALTRDTNFLGSENPSVFGTSGGGRNEEATGSPEESPQFGTTGNGSLGSKKRKEAPNEAQDEGREVKRTRRNK